MKRVTLLAAIGTIGGTFVVAPIPVLAQDVIAKRQDLMESFDNANKVIRVAAKEKNYGLVESNAREMAKHMNGLPDLFPKGSISEKSEAHPDIWNRWEEFRGYADKARAAAEALQKAAAAKDDAQVTAQVKAIGGMRSGTCGECHLSFNKKRMNK